MALEQVLKQEVKQIKSALKNGIKRSNISLASTDTGKYQIAQVNYFKNKTKNAHLITPYGLACNPSENEETIMLNVMGQEENTAAIPYAVTNRFKNLVKGEVRTGNPLSNASILYRNDGVTAINGSEHEGLIKIVDLTTKLNDLVTDYNLHMHTGVQTGGGVSGTPSTSASSFSKSDYENENVIHGSQGTGTSGGSSGGGGAVVWGSITGVLSNQTDLQAALDSKISTETDPVFSVSPAFGIVSGDISNWNTAYGWGDHSLAGYLTSETDPVFIASPAAGITSGKISNWDTAFGWGDHTGLYDTIGTASGIISTHESTYNHSLITTALQNIVEDTTPQLGGNLDALTNDIENVGVFKQGTVDNFNAEISTLFRLRNTNANMAFSANTYSNTTTNRNAFTFNRFAGTESSPATVLANSTVFGINANAYDGASNLTVGQLFGYVDNVNGIGDISFYWSFLTREDGGSFTEKLRIADIISAKVDMDLEDNNILNVPNLATKTTANINISVGSGGDYSTYADAIASIPDCLAHNVTITILKGTTLTEEVTVANKLASVRDLFLVVQSEKYYPTTGITQPTADSATATTLRDTSVFISDDEYNDCWVIIVDGTGTDNGFIKITDTIASTGDIVVASWTGTQPDNTSKYMIVGALVDCQGTQDFGINSLANGVIADFYGIGVKDANQYGIQIQRNIQSDVYYCAVYNSDISGINVAATLNANVWNSAAINCNTDNNANHGGIKNNGTSVLYVLRCALSDNNQRGIYVQNGGFGLIQNNIGDGNGLWGTYAQYSGQARIIGTEPSGSSGNHSSGGILTDGSLAYI